MMNEVNKKRIGCSIIFVDPKGQILLHLRDNKSTIKYPDFWDLIGGGLEKNETPEECIIREAEEETEIKLEYGNFHLFRKIEHPDRTEYTFWSKSNLSSEYLNSHLHEGQRVEWVKEKDLPVDKIAWGHEVTLADFFKLRPDKQKLKNES